MLWIAHQISTNNGRCLILCTKGGSRIVQIGRKSKIQLGRLEQTGFQYPTFPSFWLDLFRVCVDESAFSILQHEAPLLQWWNQFSAQDHILRVCEQLQSFQLRLAWSQSLLVSEGRKTATTTMPNLAERRGDTDYNSHCGNDIQHFQHVAIFASDGALCNLLWLHLSVNHKTTMEETSSGTRQ